MSHQPTLRTHWGTVLAAAIFAAVLAQPSLEGRLGHRGEDARESSGTPAASTPQTTVRTDTIRRAREGEKVPGFAVGHLRDSTRVYEPSDFDGRYVLLNLWATWCGPCVEKIPALQEIRTQYAAERLAILNVSFDHSRSEAIGFLQTHDMPGRQAYAGSAGLGGSFGAKFARVPGRDKSVRALPSLALIGPEGEVVELLSAEKAADTNLSEMLKDHLS